MVSVSVLAQSLASRLRLRRLKLRELGCTLCITDFPFCSGFFSWSISLAHYFPCVTLSNVPPFLINMLARGIIWEAWSFCQRITPDMPTLLNLTEWFKPAGMDD